MTSIKRTNALKQRDLVISSADKSANYSDHDFSARTVSRQDDYVPGQLGISSIYIYVLASSGSANKFSKNATIGGAHLRG